MPPLFDQLNSKWGPFDFVFLELATSIYGAKQTDSSEWLNFLHDLFSRIQMTGAKIGLINLYRDDIDYAFHAFDMVLESISSRYSLPLLNKAAGLLEEYCNHFCQSLLRDVVHTNSIGSAIQEKWVLDFIEDVFHASTPQKFLPLPRFRSVDMN